MNGNYGLHMTPMLLCGGSYACGKSISLHVPARNVPDVGGAPTCPDCGEPMVLASYGIVDDAPSLRDLGDLGLRRARGTWWR